MDYLIEYFKKHNLQQNAGIAKKELIEVQKELSSLSFAPIPLSFCSFLYAINGLKYEESAILGVNNEDEYLDIVKFNQKFNQMSNTLILAYDESTFLLYDDDQKKYLLFGRDLFDEMDEYTENELDLALNSLIHINDD